jgi:NAD-dependent dihydropyrimidine dehydrogenase PreA subunit
MAIKVDLDCCTGCGVCILICPSNVIHMDREKNVALAKYNRDCASCRLCQEHCPFECIEVITRFVKKGTDTFPLRQYLTGLGVTLDIQAADTKDT